MNASDDDHDLHDRLQCIVEEGVLVEHPEALDVVRQAVATGLGSLSVEQRSLYDEVVVPQLARPLSEREVLQDAIEAAAVDVEPARRPGA